jgi:hypothetical protein
MNRGYLPAHRPEQVADRRRQDGKAGLDMATGTTIPNAKRTSKLTLALGLAALTSLAGCSVERPGTGADHSLDAVERQRAAMGVAPVDTSYEQAERNRLTVRSGGDTSYDVVERMRAEQGAH